MKTIKARCISDKKSIFFKKGNVYDAYIPKDDKSGRFFAFYLEDMDEPGDYALPSSMFEVVEEHHMRGLKMKIRQYDRVLLKDWNEASIVEVFKEDCDFLADIDRDGDAFTEFVTIEDIEKVLR